MGIQAGAHSSLLPSPIQGIDRGRTNYPESVLPPVRGLSHSARVLISDVRIRKSTLRGHEGVLPASIEDQDQAYTKLGSEETCINSSSLREL